MDHLGSLDFDYKISSVLKRSRNSKYTFITVVLILFFALVFCFHGPLDSISLVFAPLSHYAPFFIICIEARAISFKIKIYITGKAEQAISHGWIYDSIAKIQLFQHGHSQSARRSFFISFCFLDKIIGINTTVFY